MTNKKADIVRVYLPPDANCLLWVTDHCLRTYDRVNVIVAGKQPAPQWLTMEQSIKHCDVGIGIWDWACNDRDGSEPDVVMACAGDVPALETIAAGQLEEAAGVQRIEADVQALDQGLACRRAHVHALEPQGRTWRVMGGQLWQHSCARVGVQQAVEAH